MKDITTKNHYLKNGEFVNRLHVGNFDGDENIFELIDAVRALPLGVPLQVLVNSRGGSHDEMVQLLDAVHSTGHNFSKVPRAIMSALAHSAGAYFFLSFKERFGTENSQLLIHSFKNNYRGTSKEVNTYLESDINNDRNISYKLLVKTGHLSEEEYTMYVEGNDTLVLDTRGMCLRGMLTNVYINGGGVVSAKEYLELS